MKKRFIDRQGGKSADAVNERASVSLKGVQYFPPYLTM
ncbi:hypothetical protein J2Y02_002829 [Neobacillus drentensis]|nr:hypothetical protein [Neobacillus drentensis]